MARKLELTWEKNRKRWRKVYRGKTYVFAYGNSKTDADGYRQALSEWHAKKLEVDGSDAWDKRNGRQYKKAIEVREDLIRWHDSQGELDRSEQYRSEISELRRQYESQRNPPALELYDLSPLFDLEILREPVEDTIWTGDPEYRKQANEVGYSIWKERIQSVKEQFGKDAEKTIGGFINRFLIEKRSLVETDQITPGWLEQLEFRLKYLDRFAGSLESTELTAPQLSMFHLHVLGRIVDGEISNSYAKGIMTTTKQFVRWLWENEYIENLPRNLRSLTVSEGDSEIQTFDDAELIQIMTAAKGRIKLYLLLMLNCGMYQADIAKLKPSEVNLEEGRIERKRSKTKGEKNVPVVNYLLWPETLKLLKQYHSDDANRFLLSEKGTPLVVRELTPSGKTGKIDNVQKAYDRLCDGLGIVDKKPMKLLRKTSATKLEEHETYGRYSQYFLGHAPSSMAEKRYARPSAIIFDKVIIWLGKQLGQA